MAAGDRQREDRTGGRLNPAPGAAPGHPQSFTLDAPAKFYSVGLADNGLYLELNDDFAKEILAGAVAKYEEVLAQVQAGEFEIPFVGE